MKIPYAYILTVGFILIRCANPVTPTGGPKDEQPPVILNIEPAERQTNASPKKVTFTFNENIQLNNINEELVISPKPLIKPKTENDHKSISIIFPEGSLEANQTYSISLNKAVADLNEGNKGTYPVYLFSTGNKIDTGIIKGSYKYLDQPKTTKTRIFLTQNTTKSLYLGSISSENFKCGGLNEDTYTIIAFNDLNGNDSADLTEEKGLAFGKNNDSVNIRLYNYNKKNISSFKTVNSKYLISGILPYHTQLIKLKNPNVAQNKDTIITDSAAAADIISSLNANLYIIPTKTYNYTSKPKLRAYQPDFSKDSTPVILIMHPEGLNIQNITIKKQNDSNYNNSEYKSINSFTASITEVHSGRNKIQISRASANGSITDSFTLTAENYHPISITNADSVTLNIIFRAKSGSGEYLALQLQPSERHGFFVKNGEYEAAAWEDKNGDGSVTGPDLSKLIPGEPFERFPNISVSDKMVVEYKIRINK